MLESSDEELFDKIYLSIHSKLEDLDCFNIINNCIENRNKSLLEVINNEITIELCNNIYIECLLRDQKSEYIYKYLMKENKDLMIRHFRLVLNENIDRLEKYYQKFNIKY